MKGSPLFRGYEHCFARKKTVFRGCKHCFERENTLFMGCKNWVAKKNSMRINSYNLVITRSDEQVKIIFRQTTLDTDVLPVQIKNNQGET